MRERHRPGHAAFFVTRAGASSYGLCTADPACENDLHGCGSFGQPELGGCQPLNRRLSFVDCLASRVQAEDAPGLVLRRRQPPPGRGQPGHQAGSALGGVLCCRD